MPSDRVEELANSIKNAIVARDEIHEHCMCVEMVDELVAEVAATSPVLPVIPFVLAGFVFGVLTGLALSVLL